MYFFQENYVCFYDTGDLLPVSFPWY